MQLLKKLIRKILSPYFFITASRNKGERDELKFWDRYLMTKGDQWPGDFLRRIRADSSLEGYHKDIVDMINLEEILVLDVGSGPLTAIGKLHPRKSLRITAIDPLARPYDHLLGKYAVIPPVRTIQCGGEQILEKFKPDSFDWVNGQNSLDHAIDPIQTIKNMAIVAKPGGIISLFHRENEAISKSWRRLHQWNFFMKAEKCFVSGKDRKPVDLNTIIDVIHFESRRVDNHILSIAVKRPINSN